MGTLHEDIHTFLIISHSILLTMRNFSNNSCREKQYLLTPWCRVLIEKLTGLQLVKKFPAFYGTRRFITALTSVLHLSLSWASPIQSTYPHPTTWRSILVLSTYLRLGLPSSLFPSGFPTNPIRPFTSPIRATCPAHLPVAFNVPNLKKYLSDVTCLNQGS